MDSATEESGLALEKQNYEVFIAYMKSQQTVCQLSFAFLLITVYWYFTCSKVGGVGEQALSLQKNVDNIVHSSKNENLGFFLLYKSCSSLSGFWAFMYTIFLMEQLNNVYCFNFPGSPLIWINQKMRDIWILFIRLRLIQKLPLKASWFGLRNQQNTIQNSCMLCCQRFFSYKRLYLQQNTVANAQFLLRVPLLLSHLALVEEILLVNL